MIAAVVSHDHVARGVQISRAGDVEGRTVQVYAGRAVVGTTILIEDASVPDRILFRAGALLIDLIEKKRAR